MISIRRARLLLPLLAAAFLAAVPSSSVPRTATPGRLVIIGGALSANNEAVYRAILDGRDGAGPFCVFPTAGATPATAMDGPVRNFERYAGAGTAKGILIAAGQPETARDPAVVQQIKECSGFFFIGGQQSRVTEAFRPEGKSTPAYEALMDRWRQGAVVSGSSAGAAIMSDPMIAGGTSQAAIARGVRRSAAVAGTDEGDASGGVSITPGLGLFPAGLADQHFLARGRIGRLLVATIELDQFDLAFGIDENTALVVDGDTAWTAGASGVVVIDARDAQRVGQGATGIRVHLMGAGDRFDFRSRQIGISTDKQALPRATGDSAVVVAPEDVFAAWEFLRLLDRLGRSPQGSLAVPIAGGEISLRKEAGFRAVSTAAAGVQNTPAGLTVTGLVVDLRR